jgi:hypothetical protein
MCVVYYEVREAMRKCSLSFSIFFPCKPYNIIKD